MPEYWSKFTFIILCFTSRNLLPCDVCSARPERGTPGIWLPSSPADPVRQKIVAWLPGLPGFRPGWVVVCPKQANQAGRAGSGIGQSKRRNNSMNKPKIACRQSQYVSRYGTEPPCKMHIIIKSVLLALHTYIVCQIWLRIGKVTTQRGFNANLVRKGFRTATAFQRTCQAVADDATTQRPYPYYLHSNAFMSITLRI